MSSISGREKKKITKLLNRLDSDNLLSLAQTITANKLTLSTKQGEFGNVSTLAKEFIIAHGHAHRHRLVDVSHPSSRRFPRR